MNSSEKGKIGEAEVVKLLKDYWKDDSFMVSPGSGAFATILEKQGVHGQIVGSLAGDVIFSPDISFPFCVESKLYAEIDLYQLVRNPTNCLILQWWLQCKDDARKAKKIPLLTFRENRKKRYIAMEQSDFEDLRAKQEPQPCFEHGHITTTLYSEFGKESLVILSWDDFVELFPKESIT